MPSEEQLAVLAQYYADAQEAGHIWPAYAACEAVVETGWGSSTLASEHNNLFGQKQSTPPLGNGTIELPTKEFLNGAWVRINADFATFATPADSFAARMALLTQLAPKYAGYAAALAATTGEDYVNEVSAVWSTGPQRAQEVLEIYNANQALLTAAAD